MKKRFEIQEYFTPAKRSCILFGTLLASVITIPLSNNLNSIATILFVAACAIQQPWRLTRQQLSKERFWLIPVIYFAWTVLTYFWDATGGYTEKELERYAILLFIPLAMASIPVIQRHHLRKACLVFVAVVLIVCILCLIKAGLEYRETGDYRVFFYQYLGEQMHLNAIFLSNYCLASITWILYYAYIETSFGKRWHYYAASVAVAFLLAMIFLLSSKLIIFLTLVILVVFLLSLGYMRGFFLKALLVIALVIGSGIVAVSNLHYLKWRINTTTFKSYSGPEDDNNGIAIRLFMWETAFDMIKEKPMTGYGLRGARLLLLNEYDKKNFQLGVRGNYHSHNQYIESTLMAGIPALLILLAFVFFAFRRAILSRNFLLLLMVTHFSTQSLFESTFEVQHELVFYIFFIFLFYYHAPQNKKQSIATH